MYITVCVNPRSRFEKVEQISPKEYRVSFNVLPQKGQANQKMIELLADHFDVPKSSITLKLGKSAREKVVEVPDLS